MKPKLSLIIWVIFPLALLLLSAVYAIVGPESTAVHYATNGFLVSIAIFSTGVMVWVLKVITRVMRGIFQKIKGVEDPSEKDEPQSRKRKLVRILWKIFSRSILFGLVGILFLEIIYLFIAQPNQIIGKSMEPAIFDGDYVLVNKIIHRISAPSRGDIVIFNSKRNSDVSEISRIIGIGGDKILIKTGKVFLNGNVISEPYIKLSTSTFGGSFLKENQEVIIPENQFFVMSDDRSFSNDSREWGFISAPDIIGKVWLRYWPPSTRPRIIR